MLRPTESRPGTIRRRTVIAGAAGLVVAGSSATPSAGWAQGLPHFTEAPGVALIGGVPKVLGRYGGRWVLTGPDGRAVATKGLNGATIFDLSAAGSTALAVGSRPAGNVPVATVWQSADGVTWREALRLTEASEFTAVSQLGGAALVLGSALTAERVPARVLGARQTAGSWAALPVSGLDHVAHESVTALAGTPSGWFAAAVGTQGATLVRSADGASWSAAAGAKLADTVIQELVAEADGGVRWVANSISGATPLTGRLDVRPTRVDVPDKSVAVGAVRSTQGTTSYWLVNGQLTTAGVR